MSFDHRMLNPIQVEMRDEPIDARVMHQRQFEQPQFRRGGPWHLPSVFRGILEGFLFDAPPWREVVFLNSARTASGVTPSRSAVFCAYLSTSTVLPVLRTASAISRNTMMRPLSVADVILCDKRD